MIVEYLAEQINVFDKNTDSKRQEILKRLMLHIGGLESMTRQLDYLITFAGKDTEDKLPLKGYLVCLRREKHYKDLPQRLVSKSLVSSGYPGIASLFMRQPM